MKIKRMRYGRKRIFLGLFLFLVLLGLGVGFAFVTTKLSIEGVANVKEARWNIYFDNFEAISGSVTPTAEPVVNNDTITFSAKVDEPGNFYGFTFDIVNAGTINAELADFSVTPDFSTINYIDSTIEYNNGNEISTGDLLIAGTSKKIKVLLSYKEGIDENLYPTTDQSFNVTITIKYQQYIGDIPEANFATDSWDIILDAYKGGSLTQLTEDMNNGTTREVELDLDNDGEAETTAHLRIANLSTPSECSTTGFSQSACGFVLEFSDIITTHRMNPYVWPSTPTNNGDGNRGGWEYSDMRAFLNGKVYAYENIDYTGKGIIDALPTELSSKIIDTQVISGYGSDYSSNFITTDRLYLLSPHEVWEEDTSDSQVGRDTSYNNTRQLDYYNLKGITVTNYSGAIKKNISDVDTSWWLRSSSSSYDSFYDVYESGVYRTYYASGNLGVSPAFRIG